MQGDSHSRTVAWLKVALPLMALGLLSTLFLLSRSINPTASIPFAEPEVRDRLENQTITGPYFSGTTANGDQIVFIAETMTSPQVTGETRAEDVFVRIDLTGGATMNIKSDTATLDIQNDLSKLSGNVVLTSSRGIDVRSQLLEARLTELVVVSPGTVLAETPAGDLVAGAMTISSQGTDTTTQMVFTNGVKLLYQPKQVKE